MNAFAPFVFALLFAGCGPSVEDQVERLAGQGEEREQAKQELLLVKEQAVGPLLKALEKPRYAAARAELVEVLVSLMTRVDDPRLVEALNRLLVSDPDPAVRARLAQRLGLYKRAEAIPALLQALEDPEGEVRYQALASLGVLEGKLSEEERKVLEARALELVQDRNPETRLEALSRVEGVVNRMLAQAQQLALKAQMAQAESLYHQALAYYSHSKHALYRLGRFYLDNGQQEKGLVLLRQHRLLLEVPRLRGTPKIDGRLDEELWQQAARVDTLYQFFLGENFAAPPAQVQSTFYIGYTPEALYVGFYGHDDHPDSLVAKILPGDEELAVGGIQNQIWSDDCIELMFDARLDHRTFVQFGINSRGARADAWNADQPYGAGEGLKWAGDAELAAQVGADFWSVEFKLRFGQPQLPPPRSGTLWGANLIRNYRGQQYLQWVRTYGNGLQPDQFGLLRFE